MGLGLSILSLFFSLWGLVALVSLVCSFLGIYRTEREDRRSLRLAVAGLLIGGFSLIFSFLLLLNLTYGGGHVP